MLLWLYPFRSLCWRYSRLFLLLYTLYCDSPLWKWVHQSLSVLPFASLWTVDAPTPTRLLCPWNFPGKNTRVYIFYSRESSWPGDWSYISCISCIGRWILYHCATWEALYGNIPLSLKKKKIVLYTIARDIVEMLFQYLIYLIIRTVFK